MIKNKDGLWYESIVIGGKREVISAETPEKLNEIKRNMLLLKKFEHSYFNNSDVVNVKDIEDSNIDNVGINMSSIYDDYGYVVGDGSIYFINGDVNTISFYLNLNHGKSLEDLSICFHGLKLNKNERRIVANILLDNILTNVDFNSLTPLDEGDSL